MKAKILSIVCLLSLSTPALAHLKIGLYRGVSEWGNSCEMRVNGITFRGGVRHPLNEQVSFTFEHHFEMTLHHPVLWDAERQTVQPNKDQLLDSQGTESGAWVGVLTMSHEEGREGPQSFTFIWQDAQDALKNYTRTCDRLRWVQP